MLYPNARTTRVTSEHLNAITMSSVATQDVEVHPQEEGVHDHADGRDEERGEHVAHRLDVLQRLLRERRALTITPATNAPSSMDSPSFSLHHATTKQNAMVTIWYSSGSTPRADTARNSRPTSDLLSPTAAAKKRHISTPTRSIATTPSPTPFVPPSTGSSAKSRPTVQSCRMSVPMVIWPCSVCAPPRSRRGT